jgi:nitroreductase
MKPTDSSPAPIFEIIKSRRVTRKFSHESVPLLSIHRLLEAARWAPTAGMRRLNNYIVVSNPKSLHKLRAASPGILSYPQVIIVICIDTSKVKALAFNDSNQRSIYVDLGTATENILLAAEELKLGACPVMAFHKAAVQIILNLPDTFEPAMMIIIGHPVPQKSIKQSHIKLPTLDETVHWENYGGKTT